ncbi:hypothetical protein, partial [Pseudomonas sp. ANT_J28]|uniref:hypothetical protein n=1 Tax=Pseudomonas sp. ANT_J28 TaxID=2597352 RepID=UPI001C49B21B
QSNGNGNGNGNGKINSFASKPAPTLGSASILRCKKAATLVAAFLFQPGISEQTTNCPSAPPVSQV